MNDDDLQDLLSGAFDAQARACVPDAAAVPAPHFESPHFESPHVGDRRFESPHEVTGDDATGSTVTGRRASKRAPSRRRRVFAPLVAAAAVVAAVSIGAVAVGSNSGHHSAAGHDHGVLTVSSGPDVHVTLLNSDGDIYGVGMPVIAFFSRKITDARAFQKATTATVDGKPLAVEWYFERSYSANPLEAHLRPQGYWPANSTVHVDIAARGRSAGAGMGFDDNLTLDFRTGPRQVAVVDGQTHALTLTSGSKTYGPYPVSLGAPKTPTISGYKVIMDRQPTICITDDKNHDACPASDVQRLTYGGEYLLAAPWNKGDISTGVDSSQGSTDLRTADAKTLYGLMRIGDLVRYVHTGGPAMSLGAGYGDWNVPWSQWLTGGEVHTR